MIGWIKLHRKIINSNLYKNLNSKQRDVMMQCLLLANHDDNEWEWQGSIHKCSPGQFITSLDSLAKRCANDVKVQSIRTALLKLEKWGFLTNKSTKTGRLISIVKWATYQIEEEDTNKGSNKEPTKSQQRVNKELTTNKNDKECSKNEKKKTVFSFEDIWKRYPNKDGRKASEKHFHATVKTQEDYVAINIALNNYIANLQKETWKKPKSGSTWFNNWQDWIDYETPVSQVEDYEVIVDGESVFMTESKYKEWKANNGR
ncbi:hypothetical protein KAR91_77340 [Candidatus Pacearchaeota archaeon]|nr:hypothetical protein [Candidatus Pacearchaeota archaeon]